MFKLRKRINFYLMICGTYILLSVIQCNDQCGILVLYDLGFETKICLDNLLMVKHSSYHCINLYNQHWVGKWNGMYKLNLRGYIFAVIGRALLFICRIYGSIPLMMVFTALAALGQGPWQGHECSDRILFRVYIPDTGKVCVDGTMYSVPHLALRLAEVLETAVVGWLLELSGYVGTHAVQPQSALNMMPSLCIFGCH